MTGMKKQIIPFAAVPQLSTSDQAYSSGDSRLSTFFRHPAKWESFDTLLADRKTRNYPRSFLVSALKRQGVGMNLSDESLRNINLLENPETFTVCTAHQPVLFTGPLYYIFKIASTIRLAQLLRQRYPKQNIVPVFIHATEDHDVDEINHAWIHGKKLVWQQEKGGAVGFFPTETLREVLESLRQLLGESPGAQEISAMVEDAYTKFPDYERATAALVHCLFGRFGLVVLSMNDATLKGVFRPVMERELFEQPSQPVIEKTQFRLRQAGFDQQAHAREINLFYLGERSRNRIVRHPEGFQIVGTGEIIPEPAMKKTLLEYPERFSPNVVLRPLYQESILPNLAFVGGGGEIAYWIERLDQFDLFDIPYPMLVRRNSAIWLENNMVKKWERLGFTLQEMFIDTDSLIRKFIHSHSEKELSFQEELEQFSGIIAKIRKKAATVDPTLENMVMGEGTKQLKTWEQIAARLVRSEKARFDTQIQQIRHVREKWFPDNNLQERQDNFLPIFARYGLKILDPLIAALDPLTPGFLLLSPEEEA